MKILHVAESIRGGCGTYLDEIVPLQIDALGAGNVRCLVPEQHAGQIPRVPAHQIGTFDRPSRRTGLRHLAAALRRTIREWRPDLIHAHSTFAGALVRTLAPVGKRPAIIYCPHGWVFDVDMPAWGRALARATERILSHRCERIVAISAAEYQAGRVAGIADRRMVVIHNGIRPSPGIDTPATWNDDRLKLLFVGRLDRQKGVDILLAALAGLGDRFSVRIVGEQVVSDGLGIDAHRSAGSAEFLGWRDAGEVAAQIAAADVIVMPSRWEGFGLVAIEAMRAGKAVVASHVGGLPEIVVPGETGLLVTPEDVAALAAALRALDAPTLARMGAAGRLRFLHHFCSERTHTELMQLYADVLKREPAVALPANTADGSART